MIRRRLLLVLLPLLGAPAWTAPARADDSYLAAGQIDLMRLLPPPPAEGSAQAAAEMAEVVALEATRTPARAAQALADVPEGAPDMFGAVLGPALTAERLPRLAALFERLGETENAATAPVKRAYARLRPYQANPALHPAAPPSRSGSFPSGHATRSRLGAIVLAAMLPERRDALFARAADYAESRVIAGVHFRSDILGGMNAGTAIAAVLFNDPAFGADFAGARQELRDALGMP
jgi:acid phosphatase (class A)